MRVVSRRAAARRLNCESSNSRIGKRFSHLTIQRITLFFRRAVSENHHRRRRFARRLHRAGRAERRLAPEVAGFVRREASLKDCEKAGAVDFATTDLLAAVSNADLVILCTPLAQMRPRVEEMLPALKRGAIVTDVGSVKAGVVQRIWEPHPKIGRAFCRQSSDGRRGKNRCAGGEGGFV